MTTPTIIAGVLCLSQAALLALGKQWYMAGAFCCWGVANLFLAASIYFKGA